MILVATISVAGTFLILEFGSERLSDIFTALKHANPRLIGFLALPFVIVFVVGARFLLRKREERKWKKALLKTRAARQETPTDGNSGGR